MRPETVQHEMLLSVHGMTCAGCVSAVERALKRVPGVTEASVNLATEEARVTLDPASGIAAAALPALIRAVQDAGYRATPRADTHRADRERARIDEERANRRRLAVAVAFGLPLMFIHLFVRDMDAARWLGLLLASPVQWIAGWTFHARAARGARHGILDMNTLVTLGTFSAYLYSLAVTLAPASMKPLSETTSTRCPSISAVPLGRKGLLATPVRFKKRR